MMKNLIVNALAIRKNQSGGANLQSGNSVEIYLKNAYVSLKSTKINNPGDTVALVANFVIPEPYKKQFETAGILLLHCDFNNFCVPEKFVWSLAFYKLCAMKYALVTTEAENILLLDTDTVCVGTLKNVWQEAADSLQLYNVHSQIDDEVRQGIINDYAGLYGETRNLQHYGGEFICGSSKILNSYMQKCQEVYERLKANDFQIWGLSGDELILSIAADSEKSLSEANSYLSRYWTGLEYVVDTRCHYGDLAIWHFPGEKELGMLRLYKYLLRNDKLPKKVYKYFGLPSKYRPDIIRYILKKIIMNKGKKKR